MMILSIPLDFINQRVLGDINCVALFSRLFWRVVEIYIFLKDDAPGVNFHEGIKKFMCIVYIILVVERVFLSVSFIFLVE